MAKRVFFLSREGWFEMPEGVRETAGESFEELIRWAYMIMQRFGYRNYVVTENPDFFIRGLCLKKEVTDNVS